MDDASHVFVRVQDYGRAVPERLGQGIADFLGKLGLICLVGFEQNIAALDISDNIAKAFCVQTSLQLGHFDDIIPADIDTPEQRNVLNFGHAWSIAKRKVIE